MTQPRRYPLYCDFKELVVGRGFLAGIEVHARVIAEQEGSGIWLNGVNPGAIAEGGENLSAAVTNFRVRLKAVFVDFAVESKTFEAFKTRVTEFFKATDDETEREWEEARQAVRAGRVDLPGVHKEKAERHAGVRVVELELSPKENVLPSDGPKLAA